MQDKFLWIELPSKRRLAYREPQITMRETDYGPRKTLEFWAVNSKTKKWALERSWGGTLTENIVQATARDLLMPGMVRLEKAGYRGLFSVHDEAVCEIEINKGNLQTFIKTLCKPPPWGQGLPIEAKGWVGPRYKK
jgi:DNA polymerase bacteriophage-type